MSRFTGHTLTLWETFEQKYPTPELAQNYFLCVEAIGFLKGMAFLSPAIENECLKRIDLLRDMAYNALRKEV